jgi:hypothetical protein
MRDARERFEVLSGVCSPAKVQMTLRVGRSEVPYLSFRRHLAECVRV